jgi:hypothetical protein
MNEQSEERRTETAGWPVPSRDVLRELDRRADAWPEPGRGADAQWPVSTLR